MNFVKASLKYKQVTLTILLITFFAGVYSLLNMPRREDPKITIRQGLVVAFYPGATSEQVEEQVTEKLEQYLFQFEEVRKDKTYSTSQDGMVVINVELNERVKTPDVFWSKLRQQLLLAKQLDLPSGVRGPVVNSDFGDTEAMLIGISSDDANYEELKSIAVQLEQKLRTIKSVSKIKRIGEQKEQIVVSANSQKMSQYGISLQNVVKVVQSENAINPGGSLKTEYTQTPIYTKGYYTTEKDISNQIIGSGKQGEVVKLGDVASFERGYVEPTSKTEVQGRKSLLLAIQMQEGNNIVKFGNEVEAILHTFKQNIPKDIHVKTIVNQPELVNHNVSHFISEFFLAILSVVVVVILLLPIRVASVAAMAIPMTVAVTFALLELLGIELHQVSLAALIVVLGMVVDDAIVVADNYVELLDHGVDRWNAAWRSASDLVVPILAATVTIIASFFPMVLLTGSVGEFIRALPITVAVSLAASFIVAMVLTPLLCFVFIKKGLTADSAKKGAKDRILDGMQKGYNALLSFCVARPKTTVGLSLLTILFAGGLYLFGVKQKFFPAAERNQFVVELWMPTGTRLESTEKAVRKLEKLIRKDSRVESYATFIGTSAPRFYYNFSPEVPVPNYAQILINTHDVEETESLSKALKKQVENAVPEGSPQVKLMQQGQPLKAPVEVRVIGEDVNVLKEIGVQIETVLKETTGSAHVKNDFREDYYGIGVQLTDEADRLGFTTESVSKTVYAGFTGAVVSTMYEGNDPVDIVVRLDSASRKNFTDLGNLYVTSPVTNVHIPLRQIAELKPEWQTGKIMHRNGVRTLTVQSETTDDLLPSELLKKVQPEIEKIALPNGYKIDYGGEYANKKETFSQMMAVLGISLLLIFLVLLLQFRNLKESLIVMLTIPLSLFGALFGLWVTGNNFGFTAFVGLISLSGVVVRNAIILVDYTNELLREGYDIRSAAIESGKRRLRPIFLTAMAAAIGVIPMILSGSPMWSPLASVLAFGVIWSMLMALITVPVIYMNWVKPKDKKLLNEKEG